MAFKKIDRDDEIVEYFTLLIANVWNSKELFWEIDKHIDPYSVEVIRLGKNKLMSVGGNITVDYYTATNENNNVVCEFETKNLQLEYSDNFFNQFFDYIENNHVRPYKFIASKELVPV